MHADHAAKPGTLFRWHRGGLSESMETAGPCRSMDDLHAIIEHTLGPTPRESIAVEPYVFDARIGWNTYLVTIGGNAMGYTNGPLDQTTPNADALAAFRAVRDALWDQPEGMDRG